MKDEGDNQTESSLDSAGAFPRDETDVADDSPTPLEALLREARRVQDRFDHVLWHSIAHAEGGQSRIPMWYRGQAAIPGWGLRPSISRRRQHMCNEIDMMQAFRAMAHSRHAHCPDDSEHLSWLLLMQHHGLPTRLLDWTESLLIAIFFAVEKEYYQLPGEESDELREVNPPRNIWILSPTVLNIHGVRKAWQVGKRFCSYNELAEPVIHECAGAAFGCVMPQEQKGRVLAFRPKQVSPRMLAQHSVFTIHDNGIELPTSVLSENENGDVTSSPRAYLTRLDIPAEHVASVRQDVAALGVGRHSLFPDLDNLAAWMSVHFG